MKRIALLAITGLLTLGGWALAQQNEMLNHFNDIHLQTMQDASCQPSSSPGGQ